MKLAFYYHIPILNKDGNLFLPGYLGVFIDSLAAEVENLYLLFHEANDREKVACDFQLKQKNIQWVSLGGKTPAWHRTIFHSLILKNKMKTLEHCDVFLVRSPSPLAPYFYKYLHSPKIYFMVVGDYVDGADHLRKSTLRDRIIYQYLLLFEKAFEKQIRLSAIFVNSKALFKKYHLIAKKTIQIKTTTLSNKDFFSRENTCLNSRIELLFTGRIDPAKGLFELVESVKEVRDLGYDVVLNIVGWEDNPTKVVESNLKSKAEELGIFNCISFHGFKTVGPALNEMYRMSDIYIIPSYHEGFPRTIWEAMANSCPVIATRVGGIPDFLTNQEDCILIDSHSVSAITQSILQIIKNNKLRKEIIFNAFALAKENTLEVQSRFLVKSIKQQIE